MLLKKSIIMVCSFKIKKIEIRKIKKIVFVEIPWTHWCSSPFVDLSIVSQLLLLYWQSMEHWPGPCSADNNCLHQWCILVQCLVLICWVHIIWSLERFRYRVVSQLTALSYTPVRQGQRPVASCQLQESNSEFRLDLMWSGGVGQPKRQCVRFSVSSPSISGTIR